jgi:predicted DNA-binding ribbon-helix-helix protein
MPRITRTWSLDGNDRRITTTALEPEFWAGLDAITDRQGLTIRKLLNAVHHRRKNLTMASALRCFVVAYHRAASSDGPCDLNGALDVIGPAREEAAREPREKRSRSTSPAL